VLRVLYAAILFFLLWMNYERSVWLRLGPVAHADSTGAAFAAEFFAHVFVTQLLAVLLVGPALAAASIAAERERRTIEYPSSRI